VTLARPAPKRETSCSWTCELRCSGVAVLILIFLGWREFTVVLMAIPLPLELTTRIASEMAAAIRVEPEMRGYQVYAGTASPFSFNGLVSHYFRRRGFNSAAIQVKGRGMTYHARSVARSWFGVRCGSRADLHADGRLV